MLVTLDMPDSPSGDGPEAEQRYRRAVAKNQDRLLAELAAYDAKVERRYVNLRMLGFQVGEAALRRLFASPLVAALHENKRLHHHS